MLHTLAWRVAGIQQQQKVQPKWVLQVRCLRQEQGLFEEGPNSQSGRESILPGPYLRFPGVKGALLSVTPGDLLEEGNPSSAVTAAKFGTTVKESSVVWIIPIVNPEVKLAQIRSAVYKDRRAASGVKPTFEAYKVKELASGAYVGKVRKPIVLIRRTYTNNLANIYLGGFCLEQSAGMEWQAGIAGWREVSLIRTAPSGPN